MDKFLAWLKRDYWLIFLVNALLLLGVLSKYWSVPVPLVRTSVVGSIGFITLAVLLGAVLGAITGLSHLLAYTLVNIPRRRVNLMLYISLGFGMLLLLLVLFVVPLAFIEFKHQIKITGRDVAVTLGNIYFFTWLMSALLIHGLAGFRLKETWYAGPADRA